MGLINLIKDFFKVSPEAKKASYEPKTTGGCSICGGPIDEQYGSECSEECFNEAMMRSYHY